MHGIQITKWYFALERYLSRFIGFSACDEFSCYADRRMYQKPKDDNTYQQIKTTQSLTCESNGFYDESIDYKF